MTITVRYNSPDPDPDLEIDLDRDLVLNLGLAVREMLPHRPNRWAVDLFDNRDGSRFESTFPFDSPEQAAASALTRIEDLQRRAAEAPKRLVIVSPDDAELVASLKRLLAGRQGVQIVLDRRRPLASMDRRLPERRALLVSDIARARGWWIASSDSAKSA